MVFPEIVPPLIAPPVLCVAKTMAQDPGLSEIVLLVTESSSESMTVAGPAPPEPVSTGPLSLTRMPPPLLLVTVLLVIDAPDTPARRMPPPGVFLAPGATPFPVTVVFWMVRLDAGICSAKMPSTLAPVTLAPLIVTPSMPAPT